MNKLPSVVAANFAPVLSVETSIAAFALISETSLSPLRSNVKVSSNFIGSSV